MKKQLPSRPNLEQLKNQAKAILKGHKAAVPVVLRRIREYHPRWHNSPEAIIRNSRFTLVDAQSVIANEYGFETWSKLKAHVLAHQSTPSMPLVVRSLHEAARQGDLSRLNSLLDAHPALINQPAGRGVRTALHEAVGGGQVAAVKLLLERGADPNIRCEGDNAMPLHFAAEKQLFPIIRLLIEHGADPIGEGDYHELEVIGWATAWEYVNTNPEIVDYLIAHGARHNIFSAVAMGEVETIRELISRSRSDLERRMELTNKRRRPLHLAVVKKQPPSLLALLDLGANTESLDEAGFTALDQAAFDGDRDMAQVLLDRGAKVRLPAAIALQRTADVEELLGRDPDSLKPGGRWGNLIVRASERASGEVVEALIRAGASVDVRDDPKTAVDCTSGYTSLHAAAFQGNLRAVSVLLKYGASVCARDEKYHGTPGGWANHAGHKEVGDVIRSGSVDIMEAVEAGLKDRLMAILEEDADALNRPFREYSLYPLYAEEWYTPLAFAVTLGRMDMVQLLLSQGADATIRSANGLTLQEMARAKGQPAIAEMLSKRAP